MRIAIVCPYDLAIPGGVQSHVEHLAVALRGRGDTVFVVAAGEPGRSPAGARAVGLSLSVPYNQSVAPVALSPGAARRTLTALRQFKPDVVHVHEPVVPAVSLAASLRGPRPIVGTFHAWSDSDVAYRLARPLVRRAAQRLTVRVAVSPAAAAYHASALGLPEGSFRVIPNGVEVARFASAEAIPQLVRDGAPTLLFVGRMEPRKGLDTLVRAFVSLKASRPTIRLLVIGEGPERDRCQALLPARLRSDVLFLGRVDQEDLPRFYASADLFVSPALGGESFGIVLLEAMAAGKAVVASDIPGYRTVLRDNVEGRLTAPGDHRELARTLDTLLDNAALREAMGREGARRAQAYDWDVVTTRIRDVYDETVAAHALAMGLDS
ncbi:MAG TPA: glycosyltransferase family 4 protein [Nitriliruptorales bacterium]